MNKAILKEDINLQTSDKFNKAADIDNANYRVFLSDHDIERTIRIYKSVVKLSNEAVAAVTAGQSKDFSLITDKMRPLLSYISDNNVKLSKFFDEDNPTSSEIVKKDPNIKSSVMTLKQNLKTIQSVREAIGAVPFSPAFLASEELTDAFIDFKLDLAWNYESDVAIILNLDDVRLIDYLVKRGQKRFILAGGGLETSLCKSVEVSGGALFKIKDHTSLKEQGGTPAFPGRPMQRFVIFDVGPQPLTEEELQKIIVGVNHDRSEQWGRFNTINRADTTRVLNNLKNMALYEQTSIFHNKFEGKAAVIVCPGPSLAKNVELLKKIEGKAIIICVLHALKDLQQRGINPDIVVHIDPADLKLKKSINGGNDISFWDQWITNNKIEDVDHFVVSNYSKPDIFDVPAKNVLWMSSGLPISHLLPIDVFDYERIGGSVSHSCFDLAIELGCSAIALIGQDLAFSKDGSHYTSHAELEFSDEEQERIKRVVYGNDVEVKGWYGEKVTSNNTFISFAKAYEFFAKMLNERSVKLFNCTEGGIFIEGYEHCKFEDFINKEINFKDKQSVSEQLLKITKNSNEKNKKVANFKKFITENRTLTREIDKLLKILISIAEKKFHSDDDLRKFDKLQNKMIKKMGKNYFYSLGLQRDIHILQAGLKADPSVAGQLGYHLDFLKVAKDLNSRFNRNFIDQYTLLKSE